MFGESWSRKKHVIPDVDLEKADAFCSASAPSANKSY
jgi:hypothetical protein